MTDRRQALTILGAGTAAVLAAPMLNLGRYRLFGSMRTEYSAHAIELVERAPVLDLLGQLTLDGDKEERWLGHPESFPDSEWERWRTSGIDAMHIGVGLGGRDARSTALQFFGAWSSFIAEHDERCLRVDSAADLLRLGQGRLGIILGLQNSDHFTSVDDVDTFHGLGQRISQLTYNSRNRIGNGATERVDGGISDFGVAIIERMNAVGMAVDVSHCGDRTTLDAFEISARPVLITHSNCRALVPEQPRCKSDEAIRKMAVSGGVMGITGVRNFVAPSEPTTIEHYLDHFDHVRDLVGAQHLGIGSDVDLDGYDDMPAEQYERLKGAYKSSYAFRDKIDIDEIAHPQRMYDITEGLIRRGYSDEDIVGILGGNFARVLGDLWTPAARNDDGRGEQA